MALEARTTSKRCFAVVVVAAAAVVAVAGIVAAIAVAADVVAVAGIVGYDRFAVGAGSRRRPRKVIVAEAFHCCPPLEQFTTMHFLSDAILP